MMKIIKKLLGTLLYGPKYDSVSFVKYLRKHGCDIGEGCHFYSPRTTTVDIRTDWISIGKNTKIASGVVILAHDYSPSVLIHTHNELLLAGGKQTTIGENCFIGTNAIILPGRQIGNNCIIGAGSIVTSNIPDNMVVAGNPAKQIMHVDEFYQKKKNSYLNDAKQNVLHFIKKHNHIPTLDELNGFFPLFLERKESNFNKYFSSQLIKDNDLDDLKKSFFHTNSIFDSYSDFIDFCTNTYEKSE